MPIYRCLAETLSHGREKPRDSGAKSNSRFYMPEGMNENEQRWFGK